MRAFIVFSCLVLAVSARPEYSYNPPSLLSVGSHSHGSAIAGPAIFPAPAPLPIYHPAPITQTTVQKHIYVHVPPVDHEELAQRQQLTPVINHQKHYKIIFIKAPSAPSISEQLLRAQQQQTINEEKTLVYVLVKKPESVSNIQIPQTIQHTPSKPEVYFIKYKAEKDNQIPVQLAAPLPSNALTPALLPPLPSGGAVLSAPSHSGGSLVHSGSSLGHSGSSLVTSGSSHQAASIIEPRKPSPVYGPAN